MLQFEILRYWSDANPWSYLLGQAAGLESFRSARPPSSRSLRLSMWVVGASRQSASLLQRGTAGAAGDSRAHRSVVARQHDGALPDATAALHDRGVL